MPRLSIDPYIVDRYSFSSKKPGAFGLIRSTFDFKAWAEPSFLNAVLHELQLERFWAARDESGQPRI